MTKVFVAGHGIYQAGNETFVPDGVTLHFYAEVDTAILLALSVAALANAPKEGLDQYSPGDILPNYLLQSFTDAQMAAHLAVTESEEELLLVGNTWFNSARVGLPGEINLCATPESCGDGQHTCDGVLGVLPQAGYDEIHILACRVQAGDQQFGDTKIFPGETQPGSTFERVMTARAEFMELYQADKRDGDTRRVREYFQKLEEEDPVLLTELMQITEIQYASYNIHARDLLNNEGDRTFYHFYLSQPPNVQAYHLWDKELTAAISRARVAYLQEFNSANSEQQAAMWNEFSPAVQQDLSSAIETSPEQLWAAINNGIGIVDKAAALYLVFLKELHSRAELYPPVWELETEAVPLFQQFAKELTELHTASSDSVQDAKTRLHSDISEVVKATEKATERIRKAVADFRRRLQGINVGTTMNVAYHAIADATSVFPATSETLSYVDPEHRMRFVATATALFEAISAAETEREPVEDAHMTTMEDHGNVESKFVGLLDEFYELVQTQGVDGAANIDEDTWLQVIAIVDKFKEVTVSTRSEHGVYVDLLQAHLAKVDKAQLAYRTAVKDISPKA